MSKKHYMTPVYSPQLRFLKKTLTTEAVNAVTAFHDMVMELASFQLPEDEFHVSYIPPPAGQNVSDCFDNLDKVKKMAAQAESWVRERRLRPIYELLDSGNNRKVITEADKLIKRASGNFPCAKVLKALALIRLGKIEEGRAILSPVIQEIPTEDGTIQALSICYRELEEPETLCDILEAACKKEPSEELLTHCFMAQVRTHKYQKQHHTALSLYKEYKKPTYFGWAIASLIVKYERNPPDLKDEKKKALEVLPIKLAERMCDKFIAESSALMDDSILNLYLCTLEKLENWEKLLQVMKDHGYPQAQWSSDHFHQLYCETLTKLEKMDELFEYLKSTFIANPDEFDIIRDIIVKFGESRKESVIALLDELRENNPGRVIALADLFFCHGHMQTEEVSSRIEEDLKLAIQHGADKLSFYSDLADSFELVSNPAAQTVLKLMEPVYSETEDNYDTVRKVIKDVNFEIICREISPTGTAYDRMKRADRCFGKYLVCEKAKDILEGDSNLRTKESEFHDQFLVLAASSLITDYYRSPSKQACQDHAGFVVEMLKNKKEWICNDTHPKELKQMRSEMDPNPEVTDNLVKFLDDLKLDEDLLACEDVIFVLITAILLLEYGLKRTPYNHSFRILLAKSYSRLGANLSAWKVMQQLDLKHVQWDSLGYLTIFETIGGGLYHEAMKMLTSAENMYIGYKRESMEHVITAYKYGSFNKIPEFLGFRDQLLNSTQCGLVFCEKRLLEYLISTNAPADLRKVADGISKDLDPGLLDRTEFCDNRDFTVLQCLAEDIDLAYLKAASADADTHFYKIRLSLLFCLTKLVTHLANLDDIKQRAEIITYIDAFERNVAKWDDVYVEYRQLEIPTPIFQGMWPPRCQKYREFGCFNVLKDMLCYVKGLLNSQEVDQPAFDSLKGIMATGSMFLLNHLTSFNNTEQLRALSELSIDASFTKLHYMLETLSFMRIILECAIKIDKQRVHVWKMDTNKKGRVAVMTGHKKMHHECIRVLHDSLGALVKYTDEFREKMKRYKFNRFIRHYDKCEILLRPGFLFKPFVEFYSTFFDNIDESLRVQTDEIRKVALSLVDYIKHIDS